MNQRERITVVVAGNHQQFVRWCHEHEMSAMDRRAVQVLDYHDAQKMRGLEGPKRGGNATLVLVGTWDEIQGLGHIRDLALTCGFEWPGGTA